MKKSHSINFILILLLSLVAAGAAQTKKPKTAVKKPAAEAVPAATPKPSPVPTVEKGPAKKTNQRPGEVTPDKTNGRDTRLPSTTPVYFYEFSRPGFNYDHILIEHDEAGLGKITFRKDGWDAQVTDPVNLTPATLTIIKEAFTALNFLDSVEHYQHERDFATLGDVSITLKREGRSRTAKFNYTDNKYARALSDEYRRIANEYIWRFEIITARQNQPLQTPALMDNLDGHLRRDDISDPPHLLPFLTELANDERLPLMARNHAAKLVKQIEKKK